MCRRLHRNWVLLLVGAMVTGCGRTGLLEAARDSGSAPDLSPSPTDSGGSGSPDNAIERLCNNGVLDPGEDCEDGNLLAGDGCDPRCHYEPGLYAGCGNGKRDPGEGCDDGNQSPGDGCSPDCCLEGCWACKVDCIVAGLRPCHCGNGMLERDEECDDGNLKPGDGCNQYCGREHETCGNGRLEPGEQCDDGNRKNGDGCDAACLYDPPTLACKIRVVCADGTVSGSESCDDGNTVDLDGCSSKCTIEPGFYCPNPGEPCRLIPATSTCGDGWRDPAEACDDGVNDGRYNGCNPDCSLAPRCGDGILQPAYEVCDQGERNVGGYGECMPDCTLGPYCGDGIVELPYEDCDVGPNDFPSEIGCTACRWPPRLL